MSSVNIIDSTTQHFVKLCYPLIESQEISLICAYQLAYAVLVSAQ